MANNEQINALINQLSQHLNADVADVEQAVKKGNLDKMFSKMPPQQAQKIANVLNNPVEAQKVLSTPQAQALIKKLMG